MIARLVFTAAVFAMAGQLLAQTSAPPTTPERIRELCAAAPVEACVKHHGRLSSGNGIPFRLWLVGTTRILAVANGMAGLPAVARPYLEITSPNYSDIFGDFTVCPLEHDTPGHMRSVCVTDAENLVVQPLSGPHPAFRLSPTWK